MFEGMGLITASDATKTTLGSFQNPVTLIALFGLLLTAGLMVRRVKGGMLWGILGTALVGWSLGIAPPPQSILALPEWPGDLFGQAFTGLSYLTVDQLGTFIAAVFILLFITVLDSVGAMVGLGQQLDDLAEAIPAFLVILMIPMAFSLADGLALGFISYGLIKIFQGKFHRLKGPTILIAGFSVLYFGLITFQS